jgi:hypothetical protein
MHCGRGVSGDFGQRRVRVCKDYFRPGVALDEHVAALLGYGAHFRREPIATARQSHDVATLFGRVAQCFAQQKNILA